MVKLQPITVPSQISKQPGGLLAILCELGEVSSEQPIGKTVAQFRCPTCSATRFVELRFLETLDSLDTVSDVLMALPRHLPCDVAMSLVVDEQESEGTSCQAD